MAQDAFGTVREALGRRRPEGSPAAAHWADPLFRDRVLERKVTNGLIAEAAARRREAGLPVVRLLVVDLAACGASPHAVGAAAAALGGPGAVDFLGLGVPERGSRGLIERGIAEALPHGVSRPTTIRCAFSPASARDASRAGIDWREVSGSYDWAIAIGLDGRAGRNPDPAEPLGPSDFAWIGSLGAGVISFLDPDVVPASLPLLALTAASIDCSLRLSIEAVRGGAIEPAGEAAIDPGVVPEAVRRDVLRKMDAVASLARRVTIEAGPGLAGSCEALEMHSPGFVEDRLLAGIGVRRMVPAGSVRVAVVGGAL